ncbi:MULTISPECIES: DUF1616 domain-containing protein [Methanobacterium]|uniref:DUF1616 domain-containing protein n=1 Tax=Methanobacterium veterum TaxID=408577 RepID=A0A9E4ZSZ4_9EURY|nr:MULTISPECIES: DUF1616 domain-containing protein [Methanobacterium]MCZ3364276.1 DUF1616 domain-containing protein [Methanobacterium veterum]MCZ3372023.1 DUF1616 domain-containing protein [Methanobacterium veterum]
MKRPNNTDIILVVLLAVISIVCITTPHLNKYIIVLIPYGLLLFFLPGYSIVTALSIKKSGLITKILVGILISMVITFILISTIHYTNTPFRYRLIIIALFTILFAAVGYIRRVIASRKPDRYVICESCNGYYKLEEGESLEDFEACRCGGELRYAEDNFMSKKEPKRKKKSHKEKKSKKPKAEDPQYIVCENCGGHYTLKKGESLEDFESCRCGGRLKYAEKYFKLNPKGRSKIFSNSFLLVIILTLAAVIAVVFNSISGSIIRSVMVLPLLFFLSGYSIINIIHPHLSKFKLAISSFILSTIVTFLLCLAFSSIVKISPANVITALACLTIILTVFSKIRDPKLSKAEKEGEEKKVQKRSNLGTALLKSIAVRNKQSTSPTENSVSALPKSPQKAPHDKKPVFKLPEESRIAIPSDIILVWLITALCIVFVLTPVLNDTFIRVILGILLILFIPGYSLIAALFPKKDDLDGIERTALSFGLSIAVTPLIGLLLNYTPFGIRLEPVLISLSIFTMVMSVAAYIRRWNLPEEERFNVNFKYYFNKIIESFKRESGTDRILSIVLAVSIILAISATAYVIAVPKEGEKFTEFYILGPDGKASNYPTNLTVGQTGNVTVGIVNHEYSTVNYEMIIKLNNQTINDTNITLSNNETWQQPFTFTPSIYGQNQELEFLLYKLPDNNTVYRSLHLWVNVG